MNTAAAVERRSQGRARTNRILVTVLAGFTVICMLILAAVLQRQQSELSSYVQTQCRQRKVNAIRTNATWDALEQIERRNKFIDDNIRTARIKVFRAAKLVVPVCEGGS